MSPDGTESGLPPVPTVTPVRRHRRAAEPDEELDPELIAAAQLAQEKEPVRSGRHSRHARIEDDLEAAHDGGISQTATATAERAFPTEAHTPADTSAVSSRAGRNLPAAIGVGLALGAVVLASLLIYRRSFVVVIIAAVGYGCWEIVRALAAADTRVPLTPVAVGGIAMQVAAWERGSNGLVVGLMFTIVAVLVWRLGDGARGYRRDITHAVFMLMYLPTLAGCAVLLTRPHDGAARVITFIAIVVCSDTGGYAAGVLFGRHPLAPIVSKGKTWEGFCGSVLATSICGALLMMFTFHHAWWQGVLLALALVVTATLGDLGESLIKRDLGLKDMGNLLPGHGGLMDRLDSLLPCAAVAYLVMTLVLS